MLSRKSKKIIYFILSFSITAVLSGCSLPFAQKFNPDNWRNEIVMGRDCGVDGLQCCIGQDPSCQFGLECCTDPNNPKATMCSKNCICGEKNNFCCQDPDNKCGKGLVCASGICKACGSKDQPCCEGESACNEGGLICYQSKCYECGITGNPCCLSEPFCIDSDKFDEKRSDCQDGVCGLCGSADKMICGKEPICTNGLMPNNGLCLLCGGLNQPCCTSGSNKEYDCDPALNLQCLKGFCSK